MSLWQHVYGKTNKIFSRYSTFYSQLDDNLIFFNTKVRNRYITNKHSPLKKHLVINPDSCLQDELLHIQAKNLVPGAEVTLTSTIKDGRGQIFFTYTHYRADNLGTFDLKKDGSIGGSYKGLFPMGPIACLSPAPTEHKYLRFLKKDVMEPLVVNFNLLKGHVDAVEASIPDPQLVIDSGKHERIYMAPGIQRIPVRQGKLRGTLFLPKGDGPFPGVVDLFGTNGGLLEFRSAQFASRGIASLALAYLDFEDLPSTIEGLDLDYFEEAAHFLMANEKVKKCGVGAVGVSKGADLACSMGTFIPEVRAAICINGIPVNTWWPLKTKKKTYPELRFDFTQGKIINSQLISSMEMMNDSKDFPETYIPMHESNAEFLFIVALDDQNWKTDLETTRAIERIKAHGKSNYEVFKYEGAGHLIEPPFSPFSFATYHKMAGTGLVWGGSAKEHSEAQEDSWNQIIRFIKKTLV